MKSRPPRGAAAKLADAEAVFPALAHASRRQILLVLYFRGGQMAAGDIADRFTCTWPTTTRHLRVLERAGLVRVEKRGRVRVYRLNRERLVGVAREWLGWFHSSSRAKRPRKRGRPGSPSLRTLVRPAGMGDSPRDRR